MNYPPQPTPAPASQPQPMPGAIQPPVAPAPAPAPAAPMQPVPMAQQPGMLDLSGADASGGYIPDFRNRFGDYWFQIEEFEFKTSRAGKPMVVVTGTVKNVLTPSSTISPGEKRTVVLFGDLRYMDSFNNQVAALLAGMFGVDPGTPGTDWNTYFAHAQDPSNPLEGTVMKVEVYGKEHKTNKDPQGNPMVYTNYRFPGLVTPEEMAAAGTA